MDGLAGDVRAAVRGLSRARGFTAAAVGTLCVAIAVNAALFSFMNALHARALPWPDADRLYRIGLEQVDPAAGEAPRLAELRDRLAGTAELGAYHEEMMVVALSADERAARLVGTRLEPEVLALLGTGPVAGRLLEAGDAARGAPPVVLLDADLAAAQFGDPRAAIGGTVRVDGVDRTVVGVLPSGTAFPDFARLWTPIEAAALRTVTDDLRLVARIPPHSAPEDVARRFELSRPDGWRAVVRPFAPDAKAASAAVLGAVVFLLLIACGNVANLVLARGTARLHELGVRAVLGASRGRLLRVLAAEGAVLAASAALAGGLAGAWLTDGVVGLIPADQLPLWFSAGIDVRVVAWIAGAAALSTILVSGLPALALTRGGLTALLATGGSRGPDARGGRLRAGLVVVQLALATTLLAGAGVLARSLIETRRADPGYAASPVLRIETHRASTHASDRFVERALTELAALPDADRVAARAPALFAGPVSAGAASPVEASAEAVTPGFFEALRLPVTSGRTFTSAEVESGAYALLSRSLADRLFGAGESAIGREVIPRDAGALTVVGVTGDRRDWPAGGLGGTRPALHLYVPLTRGRPTHAELLVRSGGDDPLALAAPAVERLSALSSDIVIPPPRTLDAVERERATDLRVFATLFGAFGALALALAAFGIYGVVAYAVTRRTREIGVRVALGATTGGIARLVARGVMPSLGLGLAMGIAGAIAITRALRGVLFGVSAGDPVLLLAIAGLFAATTALAAWLPARRAARVDPLTALRAH